MATKIRIGDPKPKDAAYYGKGRTPLDDTADIRDIVSAFVGRGYTNLADDDIKGGYARMTHLLGAPKAQKLMTQIFLHNQRPENQKLPVEDRISRFYDAGSGDPETNQIISKSRQFGYGVLPGFRTSSYAINQGLQGQSPLLAQANPNEALKEKIRLKINK